MATRHRIGTLAELTENEGKRFQIDGHRIAVFRRGSRVHAVGDSCPHMGASLSDGYLNGCTVICPWHGWVFDLETGVSPFDEDAKIAVFRVAVENGEVFLEMDAAGPVTNPRAADCRAGES
jgi:nitrite reductase (NADH) small subunit/3-phenylpropionate/trans-cinnamate dioxygenase ferredoxin subunit